MNIMLDVNVRISKLHFFDVPDKVTVFLGKVSGEIFYNIFRGAQSS